jgi:hypothetical protein
MTLYTCCRETGASGAPNKKDAAQTGFIRRIRNAAGWLTPSVGLVLLPKCPVCLAAYLAIGTGLGVSLTTAARLRTSFEFLCFASLAYLAARRVPRLIARLSKDRSGGGGPLGTEVGSIN